MIDEERTFEEFGYKSTELSYGSNKKVWAICDNCGKERLLIFFYYRDLCSSCVKTNKKNSNYGKHPSKEAREKMSIAHSGKNNYMYGRHHSDETKQKISKNCPHLFGKNNPHYGKTHSDETKQKMSRNHVDVSGKNNPNYGKIHSKETRQKMSNATSKEKHPNWKGGISSLPYCYKFNNKLKEIIRKRDNYICQLCEKTQEENKRRLTIHHIHYDKENCNPDLITLCISCNTKVNQYRDYWEQYFMRLLSYNNYIKIYNIEIELNIWNYGDF